MDRVDPGVEALLNDFVFRDCRLGEHPKVHAHVSWLEGNVLVVRETAPPNAYTADIRIPLENSLSGYALRTNRAMVVSDVGALNVAYLPFPSMRSELAVPILSTPVALGVLNLESTDKNFFSEADIGRSQLLGTLLAFCRFRHLRVSSPITTALGLALKRVREELGLSQLAVAERLGHAASSMALISGLPGVSVPLSAPILDLTLTRHLNSPRIDVPIRRSEKSHPAHGRVTRS